MNARWKGYLQLILFFAFAALLIRFFPIAARIAQGAAMGIREFWWAILILALGGLSIWVLRRKR